MADIQRITAATKIGKMDKNNTPAAYCDDGDRIIFETLDCSDGAVKPDGSRDRTPGKYIANPATGPLFVKGANPGDVLEVKIVSLKIGDTGFMGTNGTGDIMGRKLSYPRRIFDVSDGKVKLGGHVFATEPMIGVIGVAPAGDGIDTMTPDYHGGNMDCTRIREGAVLYFPVSAPGALLAMGDLHAAMGDGETAWYGLETPGEVCVEVHVVKGRKLRWPVCIDRGVLSVIASAKTTDECCELAISQLYDLLLEGGWNPDDALYLMSLKCNLAVCQIVDPNMTVRAEMAVEFLKPKKS